MVVLDGAQRTYRMPVAEDGEGLQDAWSARAVLEKKTADQAAKDDTCPACNTDNGIRFLGTALAAPASATVTQRDWQRRVRDIGHAGAGPADPVWEPYGPTRPT